jgi:hypothetical protein
MDLGQKRYNESECTMHGIMTGQVCFYADFLSLGRSDVNSFQLEVVADYQARLTEI